MSDPSEHGSSAAAAGKSREGELRIIGHCIGDDGWPDEIWEGVNRCEITLHLDTGPLKDVRGHVIVKTIDGDKRGEVGDWIVTSGDGSFDVWKADIFNPLCSRLQPAAASEGASPEAVNQSALRAQVIEECASELDRLAKEARIAVANFGVLNSPKDQGRHLHEASGYDRAARAIRSLSAVSAIAQERDVGKPVAYIVEGQKHRHLQWTPEVARCDAPLVTIQPLYLHPTTSPSAISEAPSRNAELERLEAELHADINDPKATVRKSVLLGYMAQVCDLYHAAASEAPTSADAVSSSPDVAAMASRLYDLAEDAMSGSCEMDAHVVAESAASLLIALDAERGRLKLKCDQYHRDFWDVEGERRRICMLLEHHSNSSTPVELKVKEALAERGRMREALEGARQFIVNGVELGFIHIPNNDPAEHTLGKINAALKES